MGRVESKGRSRLAYHVEGADWLEATTEATEVTGSGVGALGEDLPYGGG